MASNSMLRRCLRMLPSVARFHCNRTLTTAIYRPTINLINPVSKSNHLLGALYLTTVKPSVRFYSDSHGPTKEEVENRVMEVLKSFDKVDVSKVYLAISDDAIYLSFMSFIHTEYPTMTTINFHFFNPFNTLIHAQGKISCPVRSVHIYTLILHTKMVALTTTVLSIAIHT